MSLPDEIRADLHRVRGAAVEDQFAGPFALLAERHHPVVVAERHRTRRAHRRTLALCLGAPLALLAVFQALPGLEPYLPWTGGGLQSAFLTLFVSIWPLAMILGAAWRSATMTLAERSEGTAMQLVLTPVLKRTIAAAKVLPHVRPFLWGILAALPIYALAGGLRAFLADRTFPTPLVPWPWRVLSCLASAEDAVHLSFRGSAAGLLMVLTDLGLVWLAAHWGAGLALRTVNLAAVGFRILLRLLLVGFALFWYMLAAGLAGLLAFPVGEWVLGQGERVAVLLAVAVFLGLWWIYPLRNATRTCLQDFALFDRLAMDPEDPSLRDSVRASAWWWYDGRRA